MKEITFTIRAQHDIRCPLCMLEITKRNVYIYAGILTCRGCAHLMTPEIVQAIDARIIDEEDPDWTMGAGLMAYAPPQRRVGRIAYHLDHDPERSRAALRDV